MENSFKSQDLRIFLTNLLSFWFLDIGLINLKGGVENVSKTENE